MTIKSTLLSKGVDVEELRRLLEAASSGPWQSYDAHEGSGEVPYKPFFCVQNDAHKREDDDGRPFDAGVFCGGPEDAALIAAMRNALPALLDALDMAEGDQAKQEPRAWLVPKVTEIDRSLNPHLPDAAFEELQGAVSWKAEIFCDTQDRARVDKNGVSHFPIPLYTAPKAEGGAQPVAWRYELECSGGTVEDVIERKRRLPYADPALRARIIETPLYAASQPALPASNTQEAADAIKAVLEERGHPCNPSAAARAGYEACFRLLAAPTPPATPEKL